MPRASIALIIPPYELQTMRGEDASAKLRREVKRCVEVEVASGANQRAQGFVNRDLQISLGRGQLAYRVRPIFKGDRFGVWSEIMEVGAIRKTDKN